jgi:hypothetical protein
VKLRYLTLALAVAALAGCGGESEGKATLWITRDAGARVLLVREVPAGLTAMQALDRAADVRTRYGGRYVQAINGVSGSLTERRDWFYFINGYEADRSAAEYRLHEGDVEWWDFRSWRIRMREPVVVGAFPEPFVHGFDGRRRPARVVYFTPRQRADAERLAKLVHGRASTDIIEAQAKHWNVLVLTGARGKPSFRISYPSGTPGSAVGFVFSGDPGLLLKKPPFGHLHYEVP